MKEYTNKEKLSQWISQGVDIPIFSQPFWMDAVCNGPEHWDVLLYEEKNRILAAMPYYIYRGTKSHLQYITTPPMTQTQGPWLLYPKGLMQRARLTFEKRVMTSLYEQLEQLPYDYYEQNFSYMITNWIPLYWKGYKQTTRYTYRLESLIDFDEILKGMNYNTRQIIRKAQRNGIQIAEATDPNEFYQYHRSTLEKRGLTISYSQDLFHRIYNAVKINQCGTILYALDSKGNRLAGVFDVWDKMSGYHLIAAIDRENNKTGASVYLIYESIKFLAGKTKAFDFEGSMIESIEEAYRHFGAIQKPYFHISKILTKNPLKRFLFHLRNRDIL